MPYMQVVFFNDAATTEIYTLSLHDALPICEVHAWEPGRNETVCGLSLHRSRLTRFPHVSWADVQPESGRHAEEVQAVCRSEEHTSELQSRQYLVCRLLLEKKKHQSPNYLFR